SGQSFIANFSVYQLCAAIFYHVSTPVDNRISGRNANVIQ
ncbi:hypothetical protein MPER_02762, partial [Moniliophthora perniciosa FA553]